MMLAQATDLPSVPDSTLKWTLVVLVTIGLIVMAAYATFRKPEKTRVKIDDDPAVEVRKAPKRYNYEATELRFTALEQTAEKHESRLGELEEKSRTELHAMELRLNAANELRTRETRELITTQNANNEDRALEIQKQVNTILEAVGEMRGELRARK